MYSAIRNITKLIIEVTTNKKLLILLLLGISSGLPLALTASTLQAWFAVENINIKQIGLLTLASQPYALKFLWAPLLDRFSIPIKGYRTGWVFVTQILLALAVFCMIFCTPRRDALLLAILAVIISFLSATQDIAYDAYKTEILEENQRAYGATAGVFGYRIGMLISGGGGIFLGGMIGWQNSYLFMALLLLLCSCITLFADEPQRKLSKVATFKAAVYEPFIDLKLRQGALMMFILVITYKLGEAFALSLNTSFLIQGLNFSPEVVGIVTKLVGFTVTILGMAIGGVFLNRWNLYKSLLVFGILQAVTNLLFVWLAIVGHNLLIMVFAIAVDNLAGGMGTAAFVVLLMSLCNERYTATQFALLSAIASIGRIFAGPLSGQLVTTWGWEIFFVFSFFVSLPGIVALWLQRNHFSGKNYVSANLLASES